MKRLLPGHACASILFCLTVFLTGACADDSQELKALVEKFFALYHEKDLDGFMTLWSQKSPDYASRKQSMQRLFAANDYTFANSTVSRVKMEGEKAALRVAVDMNRINLQTKRASKDRMVRNFAFIKEGGVWKVWRYAPAVDDLADALVALALKGAEGAQTGEERKALLADEKELVTVELRQTLIRLGNQSERKGNESEALTIYHLAQSIAQQIGDEQGYAWTLINIGNANYGQGNYAQAFEFYQKGLARFEALEDKAGIASALNNLGLVHERQGNYAQALEYYQRSLTLKEASGDKTGIARSLHNLGEVDRLQGNYGRALEFFQKSLTLREALGDKVGSADTLNNIGLVHWQQSNYAQALEYYEKALSLRQALGDKRRIATTLNNIGLVHRDQGNYALALEFYQQSRTLAEAMRDKEGIALTLNNIGLLHKDQGKYALALEFLQQGLELDQDLGNKLGISIKLDNIGIVHSLQGDYRLALEFYQQSLALRNALGDKAGQAMSLHNFGEIHRNQGNYVLALEFYQKSLAQYEAIGVKRQVAHLLNDIGLVAGSRGDDAQALEHFQRSLAMREALGEKRSIALALHHIGGVHGQRRNYGSALEFYQKSLSITEALEDKAGIADTLNSIGVVHVSQGNYPQALDYFQRSMSIAEAIGHPAYALRNYRGIGDVYKAQGRKEEAIAFYQKAITALEAIRSRVAGGEEEQLTFLHAEGKDDVYQSLVSLLIEQGRFDEALSYLERARSKRLLDGIRLRSLTVRDDNLRALLHKTSELEQVLAAQDTRRLTEMTKPDNQQDRDKVTSLTQLVAQTREELRSVINAIRAANPDYERFVTVKVTDLPIIQRQLPGQVIVVEYVPLETALTILLVTKDSTRARSVAVSRARIEQLVDIVHKQVQRASHRQAKVWDWQSSEARPLREALISLYGYLIVPIQADIAKYETVVVVPSGVLYYLPFQALARELSDAERRKKAEIAKSNVSANQLPPVSMSSLRFFVEEKSLAILTSLQLWDQIIRKAAGNSAGRAGRLSAFGNPDGSLPAAEKEVKHLGALFSDSLVFTGPEVSREKLMSLPADVTIGHFATHGILNERDVNECYLTLANGDRLKLGEIYGLVGKYPAKLTVLSACETALGGPNPGNEVSSLADGFVEAGSTTIMASLWKVSDESTALFMEHFYKGLKAGGNIAEAKRQAEITLLQDPKTAHPYFWGPFVLIGDWR